MLLVLNSRKLSIQSRYPHFSPQHSHPACTNASAHNRKSSRSNRGKQSAQPSSKPCSTTPGRTQTLVLSVFVLEGWSSQSELFTSVYLVCLA